MADGTQVRAQLRRRPRPSAYLAHCWLPRRLFDQSDREASPAGVTAAIPTAKSIAVPAATAKEQGRNKSQPRLRLKRDPNWLYAEACALARPKTQQTAVSEIVIWPKAQRKQTWSC